MVRARDGGSWYRRREKARPHRFSAFVALPSFSLAAEACAESAYRNWSGKAEAKPDNFCDSPSQGWKL